VATVGLILTLSGATMAGAALRLLRAECCPRCGTAGALATVDEQVEEIPGCDPRMRRLRHCGECDAVIEDGRVLGKPRRLPWETGPVREVMAR